MKIDDLIEIDRLCGLIQNLLDENYDDSKHYESLHDLETTINEFRQDVQEDVE